MSTPRIRQRVASAAAVCAARLHEHSLRFHKKSVDGSAKCDILHTRDHDDVVHGVLFNIDVRDKRILDGFEGLGNGYESKQVRIKRPDGRVVIAATYNATRIDASLQPYHWYKEHVLRGAREHALPAGHIAAIEAVESMDDPDAANHAAELAIYRDLDKNAAG
jgi:gamma-glutamylcyclotransferase